MNEHDWIDAAIEAVVREMARADDEAARAEDESERMTCATYQYERFARSLRRLNNLREHYRRLDAAKHTIKTRQVIDTTTGEDLHP